MTLWLKVTCTIGALLLARALIQVQKLRRSLNYYPTLYFVFGPGNLLTHTLAPPIKWITHGTMLDFLWKHTEYKRLGVDVHAIISVVLPYVRLSYKVADPEVIKQIVSPRAPFRKPSEHYAPLSVFGPNIVASHGDEWKKYRKIVAPAFSENNNKLIWDTSVKVMLDLFDDVWGDRKTVVVDHAADLTFAMTLLILGSGVFGMDATWNDRATPSADHQITFQESLRVVAKNVKVRVILPKWAYALNKKLKAIGLAFEEMEAYMREMIQERTSSSSHTRHDLLSTLIEYNKQEDVASALDDSELLGNLFIMLIAGHETGGHTLCFALALLAMYQDEQEALYQDIKSILPASGVPEYSDLHRLKRCHAVYNETLRLYPSVPGIPKLCTADTTLTTVNHLGEKIIFPVPKGTMLMLVPPAVHYNPRYWPDPYAFKPERFMKGDWPRDAFMSFSTGSRMCLGRRFFETEATAILALLISRYKVTIKDEPEFANETLEQKKARIFKAKHALSLTPLRVPLVFTKRD